MTETRNKGLTERGLTLQLPLLIIEFLAEAHRAETIILGSSVESAPSATFEVLLPQSQ